MVPIIENDVQRCAHSFAPIINLFLENSPSIRGLSLHQYNSEYN
jgi:hypothetical protein